MTPCALYPQPQTDNMLYMLSRVRLPKTMTCFEQSSALRLCLSNRRREHHSHSFAIMFSRSFQAIFLALSICLSIVSNKSLGFIPLV